MPPDAVASPSTLVQPFREIPGKSYTPGTKASGAVCEVSLYRHRIAVGTSSPTVARPSASV